MQQQNADKQQQQDTNKIKELGQLIYAYYGFAPSFELCRQLIYSLGIKGEPDLSRYSTADYHIKRLAKECCGVITKEEMIESIEKLWR